jgi:general secretion pathway protein C
VATVAELLRTNGGLGGQLLTRAPQIVAFILAGLIGWRVAVILVQLAGPPVPEPFPAAAAIQLPTNKSVDVTSVLRANLFGQSDPVLDSKNAPVTSMPLVLGGVLPAWDSMGRILDPKNGFAAIGTSATDVRNYRVGGVVPGGARLHEVHRDRVLLDRSGSIEALLLPLRLGTPAPLPPPVATGAVPVQRVQQVIRDNPAILNQIMSRSAVFTGGKLQGMRVNPGPNRQAFDKLGLRPGDLVTAINGTQLSDQTRAEEVFNSLSSAAEANITVERNGTRQELHLNLAEIANEAERLAQGTANPGPGQPPGPDSAR